MKDVSFYEIIINKEEQKIVSAVAEAYDLLGEFVTKPMYELIAPEDMDIYKNNVKNCDGEWYPSKMLAPDKMYYTYMRAEVYNDDLIRLTVVNADDLLNAHSNLMKTINTMNAQLNLYEDVFFEYDFKNDTLKVYNTELADFDTGTYSLSEFEDLLLNKTPEDQKDALRGFFTQVKTGCGRSSVVVEANLLNEDETMMQTVLDEAFVFHDKESEGVVGRIQIRGPKGNYKSTFIKHDSLTGLVDKADITRIARERIDERGLEGTALVIVDIDFFKSINDNYGHQFGDEVLKKIGDIISNEVGSNGLSGRFGGDEFFVVLYNIKNEEQLRPILKAIKTKVGATFPDKGFDRDNPLSVSIGTAVFPEDADNYDDLFLLADQCLYLAKEKGRNRYIIYNQQKHGSLEDIKIRRQNSKKINERDLPYGDVIVRMFDMALHDKDSTVEHYMSEFAEAFDLQNVALYVGPPFKYRYAAGSRVIADDVATDFVLGILNSDDREKYFTLGDFMVFNHLGTLPPYARKIKEFLVKREVYSLIIIRFYDIEGRECILTISSVGKKTQWNRTHFKYYRAFTDLLSLHDLSVQ